MAAASSTAPAVPLSTTSATDAQRSLKLRRRRCTGTWCPSSPRRRASASSSAWSTAGYRQGSHGHSSSAAGQSRSTPPCASFASTTWPRAIPTSGVWSAATSPITAPPSRLWPWPITTAGAPHSVRSFSTCRRSMSTTRIRSSRPSKPRIPPLSEDSSSSP